jgi:2-aminoethylphosphonate-pyruvate transaminase
VNPIADIARVVKARGKSCMVDAMSSFGALALDMKDGFDVMVSSSNKCIEGVPGFSYVVVKRDMLVASKGMSHSVVLDLYEQWKGLEANGQFRFTPPTHALVAFHQAMKEHQEEGGVAARGSRYRQNAQILIKGMRDMGFSTLLSDNEAGPIIQTFLTPRDPNFDFEQFYEDLRLRGFAIYPGKLTKRPSFRIGTIGKVDEKVMKGVLKAIREVLDEMNVTDRPRWTLSNCRSRDDAIDWNEDMSPSTAAATTGLLHRWSSSAVTAANPPTWKSPWRRASCPI